MILNTFSLVELLHASSTVYTLLLILIVQLQYMRAQKHVTELKFWKTYFFDDSEICFDIMANMSSLCNCFSCLYFAIHVSFSKVS